MSSDGTPWLRAKNGPDRAAQDRDLRAVPPEPASRAAGEEAAAEGEGEGKEGEAEEGGEEGGAGATSGGQGMPGILEVRIHL